MRVAIVNDVPLVAEALRRVVRSDPRYQIAWTAGDGEEAVRRCRQDTPDVVLMDLVMPVMNGAEATRRIMQGSPCAILVVTATVAGNFELVCEALGHGAFDAVCTPELGSRPPAEAGAELLRKLAYVERINQHLRRGSPTRSPPVAVACQPLAQAPSRIPLVAIGSSTGGPPALAAILDQWPADFPAAVLLVQHIGREFAPPLVEWLAESSSLRVRLAVPGDRPEAGTALVAGSDDHLVLTADGTLRYTPEPAEYPYRPSVDALFHSLVAHGPSSGVAVLLTGIGRDGAEGMLRLRQKGWLTIAQDKATSVVYGMPQAARQLGAAAVVLPLSTIAGHVSEQLRQPAPKKP